MTEFSVDKKEITVFDFGDTYLFTAYFDENQLFNKLKKYYNGDKHRFEIPKENLNEVQQALDNYFYKIKVGNSPEEYCVVVRKEADSSELLRNSVLRKQRRQQDIFIMKDKLSVLQAMEHGATPLEKPKLARGL